MTCVFVIVIQGH